MLFPVVKKLVNTRNRGPEVLSLPKKGLEDILVIWSVV